jgi:cell division protein ZapA
VAPTKDGIRVMIYDQEYYMKGALDAEYIEKLAQYLDAKMRSIAGRTRTVDSLRVAVLAGLNIADEYHQLKTRHENESKEVSQKVGEYSDALDQILKHAV